MGDAIFVGVDVAKRSLEVGVRPTGEVFSASNDADGCARLSQRLARLGPQLVVLEASGGYERALTAELGAAKVPVVVVNPRQTRDFARALGRLEKTDQVDALMLAQFAERIRPEVRELPDAQARALAAVMARRRQLVEMLVAEQNRLYRGCRKFRVCEPYREARKGRRKVWRRTGKKESRMKCWTNFWRDEIRRRCSKPEVWLTS
jgi:transposase